MDGYVAFLDLLGFFRDKLTELEPRALDVKAQWKYARARLFIEHIVNEFEHFRSSYPPSFERFTRNLP